MSNYQSSTHCEFSLQYHLIWCPKFQFSTLQDGVDETINKIIFQISNQHQYEVKEIEVRSDHIRLLIGTNPTVSPIDVIRTLKSLSAIELFKVYPELKNFYGRCGSLWCKGYFISTVGSVSEDAIKEYILNQNKFL